MIGYLTAFLAALAFFAALEAWAGSRLNISMPIWLGLLSVPAAIALFLGGAAFFAALVGAGIGLASVELSQPASVVVAGLSVIVGLWLASIILQLTQNGVRALQGRKREPMRWIRNPLDR